MKNVLGKIAFVFKNLKERFARSARLQSGLLLLLVFCLGFYYASTLVLPFVSKGRADVVRTIAFMLYGEHIIPGTSDAKRLQAISEGLKQYGIDVWLVSQRGDILASGQPESMPMDWEFVARSDEDMTPTPTTVHGIRQLFTLKLATQVPKYLVFYFTAKNSRGYGITLAALLFALYMIGTGILVMHFYRGAKEKIMREKKGFSLLGAVVAIFILTLVLYGISQVLTTSLRGSAHADLKLALRSLSDSVKQSVSCSNTFSHFDPAVVCTSSNPVPILLYDTNNNPLTGPLDLTGAPSGNYDPTTGANLYGAGKFGNWYLRAYCETSTNNLVIRFAKVKEIKGATVTFANDPLLKRPFDWGNSASNPLFGSVDNAICNGAARPGRAYGLLGSQTFYRRLTGGGNMNINDVPASTRMIKVSMSAANLQSYGSGDEASEDKGEMKAIFNVSDPSNLTSSGFYSLIGGTNPGNIVLFTWQDQPNGPMARIRIDGWDNPIGAAAYNPLILLAAKWRPVYDYSPTTRQFSMNLPTYAPAAFAFLVEFYGE